VDGLSEAGLLDDSLVVVTGDHGETFWEHGDFWNHGLGVYQTTVRVPLLLRFPGARFAGRVIDAPVSTLDVLPTVCRLLGITVPSEAEGLDLSPTWKDARLAGRILVSEATQPVGEVEIDGEWRNIAKAKAVRQGRWKYILTPYLGNREELYDLFADPGERVNLLEDPGVEAVDKSAELRGALEAWAGGLSPLPSAFDPTQTDQVRSRLEALGYSGKDD